MKILTIDVSLMYTEAQCSRHETEKYITVY
jgi:hypothetical protein